MYYQIEVGSELGLGLLVNFQNIRNSVLTHFTSVLEGRIPVPTPGVSTHGAPTFWGQEVVRVETSRPGDV